MWLVYTSWIIVHHFNILFLFYFSSLQHFIFILFYLFETVNLVKLSISVHGIAGLVEVDPLTF